MQTERGNFYNEQTTGEEERRDNRNYQQHLEVESPLKKHFKIIMIGVVLSAIVVIMGGKCIYDDYQARQVQRDYYGSFLDGTATAGVLPLASFEISKSTKSKETVIQLLTDYQELLIVASETGVVPKEKLKKYNDSIRRILGKEAEEFLVDERWNFDCDGFVDGMTYFSYCYAIDVAHDSGAISDEEYAEFEKRDKALLKDLSHEKVMEMYPYIMELLEKGWGKVPESYQMYYNL